MGFLDKFKKQVEEDMQDMDDNLTTMIGDGDYRPRTDESTVTNPKDDGKKD